MANNSTLGNGFADSFSKIPGWAWTVSALAIVITGFLSTLSKTKLKLPPGPGAYPMVGSFPFLKSEPGEPAHRMFQRLADKFGPIVYLRMGSCPTIVISDSETAKQVLRDQDNEFASRPFLSAGKYMGMNFKSLVFAPAGHHYKKLRKIYATELLAPKRIQGSQHIREIAVKGTVILMYKEMKNGEVTNLSEHINTLSLNNLMSMIFGKKDLKMGGKLTLEELKEVVRLNMELCGEFNFGDYIPVARWLDLTGVIGRMKALVKRMKVISESLIEEHRELRRRTGEVKDPKDFTLLDVLLSLKGDDALSEETKTAVIFVNPLKAERLSNSDGPSYVVHAYLNNMIMAGSDTTSIVADWAVAELMKHPEMMKKLQNEIDSVVGTERFVKESDLPHLPYLQCVVKESLRLHPPTPLGIPHCSIHQTKLAGYDIPVNTTILVNLWAINRDPKNWKKALDFTPERFEEHDTNMFGQDFTLLPFSSGRRGCSGMVLGCTMVQLIVASVVHCFDFEPHDMKNSDIDVSYERQGLTSLRTHDLIVKAIPRLPSHLYI